MVVVAVAVVGVAVVVVVVEVVVVLLIMSKLASKESIARKLTTSVIIYQPLFPNF